MTEISNQAEIELFVGRWEASSAAERSNFQPFMVELCQLLGLPRPEPATHNEADNNYVFERNVRFRHDDGSETVGHIDLYKRGCFVLEGKQSRKRMEDTRTRQLVLLGEQLASASTTRTGSGQRDTRSWDAVMASAKRQAEDYAKALPSDHGWPPFLIVVDVGHVMEVYADFSLQGKHYAQFPDRQGYRIGLRDLLRPEIRERLRALWTDPLSIDPARRSAAVTREIAELLARLSQSLEKRGNPAKKVAFFLMRCLFTMFAEDVGLLVDKEVKRRKPTDDPKPFASLLRRSAGKADMMHLALAQLWQEMNAGGYSSNFGREILRFNGGLFRETETIQITEEDLNWLSIAANRDWTNVEPAIFGTLLERALDDRERSKLGAHYTPRAYVERLVVPTIIEPLTNDWRAVQTAAADLLKDNQREKARNAVRAFHQKLCATRVLDPACGTGNFLYVSMELVKRLEGEVLEMLEDLGEDQYLLDLDRHTVDPHQFIGLEINPRAVAIAELVLWIGYLQWHFRTRGKVMPAEPVLKAFANIKEQDAVLRWDKQEFLRDKKGHPLTRWDGVTKKLHPITGEEIPDPDAQLPLYKYVDPQPAKWPDADFVVGNPPFIGGKDLRQELGDGYAEALWSSRPHMPGGADFVTYWWDTAATLAANGKLRRFGLISTNSVTQTFSRRVIARHMEARKPVSIVFAIPDHPWLKAPDRAAVRIAMTVGEAGEQNGILSETIEEHDLDTDAPRITLSETKGKIAANLTVGPAVSAATGLLANERLCFRGFQLMGSGFIVTPQQAAALGLGRVKGLENYIRPYRNGRDLTARPRGVLVIDLFGLDDAELRDRYPSVYQWVVERVKPERDMNNRAAYRDRWWIFGEPRSELRSALRGLDRYIVTIETEKHRTFEFLSIETAPDNKLVCIAHNDPWILGVLSSRIHVTWAVASGGWLGVGNDPVYVKTSCFDPFPFPSASEQQMSRVRALADRLDTFRKERFVEHKSLTMTKLYNALDQLRLGTPLVDDAKEIHEQGLISVLKRIHDELDEEVAEAYGWPANISEQSILEKLVELNKRRKSEEQRGLIRWLRPEFQAAKEMRKPKQIEAELIEPETKTAKPNFPKTPADQITALRAMLGAQGKPIRAGELARKFQQGKRVEGRVSDLLQIMAAIGQAQTENGSRYFAVS